MEKLAFCGHFGTNLGGFGADLSRCRLFRNDASPMSKKKNKGRAGGAGEEATGELKETQAFLGVSEVTDRKIGVLRSFWY
jgi:hypothetical protein